MVQREKHTYSCTNSTKASIYTETILHSTQGGRERKEKITSLKMCVHGCVYTNVHTQRKVFVYTYPPPNIYRGWRFSRTMNPNRTITDTNTEIKKNHKVDTVVYWTSTRPDMPFQRRGSCIFHWRGRAWLTIWDRVKIPRYSHRLMHRKRVTCELHDSYFRLMTIKHPIPKIEWAIELLYNSVKTGSLLVWRPEVWRQDVVEKASTQQRAGPPDLRLSNPGERERNGDGHKSGGLYVAVLFGLQLPLTHNPFK